MKNALIIGALSAAVIGSSYWGYTQYKKNNEMNQQAENNYQRAFNELAYDIDLLHDKIGSTLAMNSRTSLSPALTDVWRLSVESKSDIGQLPLTLVPFDKTQAFLTKLGNFTFKTAVRDLDKEPLTDKEYASLKSMYNTSEDIQTKLRDVQTQILDKDLKWMDLQNVKSTKEAPKDNVIIDGFKNVEASKAYADQDFGPAFTNGQEEAKGLKKLEGKKINKEQAKKIALQFLDLKQTSRVEVHRSMNQQGEAFFNVTLNHKNPTGETYMTVTETGGYPLFFLMTRDIKQQKLGLEEAIKRGSEYLKKKHYENMELYDSSQYDTIGVLSFVKTINNVRIYPQALQLKVALDNGNVIGFNAKDYVTSDRKRNFPPPKLTMDAARKKVNPNLTVQEERLAIITNDFNKEVLCYEFLGTLADDTYDIYINANSGIEEKVKKM